MKFQTVEQTLRDIGAWRPALEPILRAFAPALEARAALSALSGELAVSLRASGAALPAPEAGRVRQGVSLLAGASLTGLAGPMRAGAARLLPALAGLEAVEPRLPALTAWFMREDAAAGDESEALFGALLAEDHAALARLAGAAGLDAPALEFAAGFVVSAVLRALLAAAAPAGGEAFWDAGDGWRQGYCPVCGALPVLGWLDRPGPDEKNAFLAGGGGKKHLHCGRCGANWKFRRGACPACAQEGNGVLEILRESGAAHGERLDWCTRCNTYCPTVDLREREAAPDLDAAALGMLHLDMVAARKKLRPLRASFWNRT